MTTQSAATLTRVQIRTVFDRHRGSRKQIAAALGVSHVSVTNVLKGRGKSARILRAAEQRALELLAEEARNAA